MSEPVSLHCLPPPPGRLAPCRAASPPQATAGYDRESHHGPGRQRLLAERALLQLAWVGLVALREGYSCPAPTAPCQAAVPETCPERPEAELAPEGEGRWLAAYRRAASLAEPRRVRLVDTLA